MKFCDDCGEGHAAGDCPSNPASTLRGRWPANAFEPRQPGSVVVGCPAWKDGRHAFVPVSILTIGDVTGTFVPPTVTSEVTHKKCKCGATVEAT